MAFSIILLESNMNIVDTIIQKFLFDNHIFPYLTFADPAFLRPVIVKMPISYKPVIEQILVF